MGGRAWNFLRFFWKNTEIVWKNNVILSLHTLLQNRGEKSFGVIKNSAVDGSPIPLIHLCMYDYDSYKLKKLRLTGRWKNTVVGVTTCLLTKPDTKSIMVEVQKQFNEKSVSCNTQILWHKRWKILNVFVFEILTSKFFLTSWCKQT